MRIAILGSRGIPASYGGFERFAEELAFRLTQKGIDVTVFCEGRRAGHASSFQGIRLEYVTTPRLGSLTTVLFDIRCLWRARTGFDVVYMLGYGAGAFCFIPRIWGTTVWINMDGIEWARSKWGRAARTWFRLMEALSVRVPDRVIADAEAIYSHLAQRHPGMKPCSVIPYGAPIVDSVPDPDILQEWDLAPGQYDLVVCRLEPENMIAEVVQGYSRSESPHPLVIVGDHRSGTEYVRTLLTMSSPRIRFIGTVYDSAKLRALRCHARSYIHGHQVGGTNPSLLEALGCGNIIIASDNAFNREVAADAALYFRSADDIPHTLHAVETMPPQKRQEMKAASTDRIRTFYDWDQIAGRYESLLEEVVLDRQLGEVAFLKKV